MAQGVGQKIRCELIDTWTKPKGAMNRCFVPSYYHHDLQQKLQTLTQDNCNVKDYFKEIEIAIMHMDVQRGSRGSHGKTLQWIKA